mmetsp:Transcript_12633/g.25772  ORF Transcript_12633/g.25772 Transcript_12633/m.25772 type:complete len:746 (-) Transcript_12633:173-2410(-)
MVLASALVAALTLSPLEAAWDTTTNSLDVAVANGELVNTQDTVCGGTSETSGWWWPGEFYIRGTMAEIQECDVSSLLETSSDPDFDSDFDHSLAAANLTEEKTMFKLKLTNNVIQTYNNKCKDSKGKPFFHGYLPPKCKLRLKAYMVDGKTTSIEYKWSNKCPALAFFKVKSAGDTTKFTYDRLCAYRYGTPKTGLFLPCEEGLKCGGITGLGFKWHGMICSGDPHCVTWTGQRYKVYGVGEAKMTSWIKGRKSSHVSGCFFKPEEEENTYIKSASLQCGKFTAVVQVNPDLTFATYYFNKNLKKLDTIPSVFNKCPKPKDVKTKVPTDKSTVKEKFWSCQCLDGKDNMYMHVASRYSDSPSVLSYKYFVNSTLATTAAESVPIIDVKVIPTIEQSKKAKLPAVYGGLGQGYTDKFEGILNKGTSDEQACTRRYPRTRAEQDKFAKKKKCGPCDYFEPEGVISKVGAAYTELACPAVNCPLKIKSALIAPEDVSADDDEMVVAGDLANAEQAQAEEASEYEEHDAYAQLHDQQIEVGKQNASGLAALIQTGQFVNTTAMSCGKTANTCEKQDRCTKWTITAPEDKTKCKKEPGNCEYTVCMEIDLDQPMCKKSKCSSFEYTCRKRGKCPIYNGFVTPSGRVGKKVGKVCDGYKQCQTGTPGSTLQFLLKDGKKCRGGKYTSDQLNHLTCEPRPRDVPSCSQWSIKKEECLWEIKLPKTCHDYMMLFNEGNDVADLEDFLDNATQE